MKAFAELMLQEDVSKSFDAHLEFVKATASHASGLVMRGLAGQELFQQACL